MEINVTYPWHDDSMTTQTDIVLSQGFEKNSQGVLTRFIELPSGTYRSTIKATKKKNEDDLGAWWSAYLQGHQSPLATTKLGDISVAELFCGPGGLAQGVKQACFELGYRFNSRSAVDVDTDALAVYKLNHDTPFTTDESITDLLDYRVIGEGEQVRFSKSPVITDEAFKKSVKNIDLLLAGPPCQGHSNLNNHTRRDDERNELYLTVPALAIAANIPGIIIENVPEVVHDRSGVVAKTEKLLLDAGYKIESGVLRADTLGWPQTRKRFFLIARKNFSPLPIESITSALQHPAKSSVWALEDIADHEPDDFMNRQPKAKPNTIRRIQWLFDNEEYNLALSERPDCHKSGTTYSACYGRMYPDKPAPTLTTGFMTPGRGRFVHPTRRRVLTPREAARIQGFPDDYLWKSEEASRPKIQAIAKWIGDAVPMPLGHAAALSLLGEGPLKRK